MKEIRLTLETDHLQSLLKGKKLCYQEFGNYQVTIYPPQYGIFLTHEEYTQVKNLLYHFTLHCSLFDQIEKRLEGNEN